MLKKAKKAKTGQHTHAEEGEESSSEGALARAGPQAWLLHLKNLNCTNVEHGDNKNTKTYMLHNVVVIAPEIDRASGIIIYCISNGTTGIS